MSGHIIGYQQMSNRSANFRLNLGLVLGLVIMLVLPANRLGSQTIKASKLAQILAKSDSLRKTLTYAGVVEIQNKFEKKQVMKLRIWRKKDEFYHQELIFVPKSSGSEEKKRDHKRRTSKSRNRRRHSNYSLLPDTRYLELLHRNYNVKFGPDETIANRSTNCLSIKPINSPRFGMNIWFDRENYLILKREIVFFYPEGEKLGFLMEYQDIHFDELPPDSILALSNNRSERSSRRSEPPDITAYPDLSSMNNAVKKPIFVPDYIPVGCELDLIKFSEEKERSVVHLHYTDGLLAFSIFQFIGKPPRPIKRMLERSESVSGSPTDFQQVFAAKKSDFFFLLIGNFPETQLKQISDSLTEY